MMETEIQPRARGDLREVGRFTALLFRGLAFSVEAFLHRGFGSQYVGVQAAVVPAIVLVFALFWPGFNHLPLYVFLAAYVAACAAIVIRLAKTRNTGLPGHYSGRPTLMRSFFFLRERTVKRVVEPMWVLLLGWATLVFHQPLGVYLVIVSIALFISTNVKWGFEHARVLEPTDHGARSEAVRVEVRRLERKPAMSDGNVC